MKKKRSKLQRLACLLVAAVLMTVGAPTTVVHAMDDSAAGETPSTEIDLIEEGLGGQYGNKSALNMVGGTIPNSIKGTSTFKTQNLLDSHYNKHGSEFGDISKTGYVEGANNLLNSTEGVMTKIRPNGDVIVYNPSENELAIKSGAGYIKTYFRPSGGQEYFDRQ